MLFRSARAERGELLFGTVETWLIWKLTGGKVHATDYSNASRTMLFNINTLTWDDEILKELNIPKCMLPTPMPSSGLFGTADPQLLGGSIPITGAAGTSSLLCSARPASSPAKPRIPMAPAASC